MNFLAIFQPSNTNISTILFLALGGLGIFLFGISIMSDSMKSLAGDKLKMLIKKTTDKTFKAILVGTLITVLIQSSSATTVIVVGLICAGLMTFPQAVGVMLGANIGTTITAFIIGLDVADYALPIIFVGSILVVFINRSKVNISGMAILGFGMLFLGLEFMGVGLKEISKMPFFESTITALSNHWYLSLFTGTFLTALIQSSSAFIGIIQKLFANGSIPLVAAIPMVFGSNIGTTVTALIASTSGNRESKQAAVANLLFNTLGVIVFCIFLRPFTSLFEQISIRIGQNNMLIIALVHVTFNLVNTVILYFFIKPFIKLVKLIVPDEKNKDLLISAYNLNEELLETSPVLALESAKKSLIDMSQLCVNMLKCAKDYFNKNDDGFFVECMSLEDKVDIYDHLIHDYLMQLKAEYLSNKDTIRQAIYLDTIKDYERIGDHATNLVEFFKDRYENNIQNSTELSESINYFLERIISEVELSIKAFSDNNVKLAEEIITIESDIDNLEKKYRKAQLSLINNNILEVKDIHYVDILANLERVSDHCCNIAENIIDPYYMRRA